MVARERVSIVDPTPGVTRDRVSILAMLESPDGESAPRRIELTDTGGYGVYTAEGARFNEIGADLATLTDDIEHQIGEAVRTADVILFVVDAQAGITPQDEIIARLLRERAFGARVTPDGREERIKIILAANKTDGQGWEAHGLEASSLGFGEPILVSAENNYCRRLFLAALYNSVEHIPDVPETEPEADMKIAIVGKRNAGKSTLVNELAGERRVIVSEIAGTTRDAVDVRFEMDGRSFIAIDTAGLRKKKSFADRVEWYAYERAQRAIRRADVILLMIDATIPTSQVDEQLAMLAQKSFKPVVLVVNKWDEIEGQTNKNGQAITPEDYDKYLRRELKGLTFAPICFMSAKDGMNVRNTIDVGFELYEQAGTRVGTAKLNRLVRSILDTRGPSSKLGTFAKVYYVAQVKANPPTIVLVVNKPELFTPNYMRFLMNRFRDELPFKEVPMRIEVRCRKRAKLSSLLQGTYDPGADTGESRAAQLDALLSSLPDDADAYFDD